MNQPDVSVDRTVTAIEFVDSGQPGMGVMVVRWRADGTVETQIMTDHEWAQLMQAMNWL